MLIQNCMSLSDENYYSVTLEKHVVMLNWEIITIEIFFYDLFRIFDFFEVTHKYMVCIQNSGTPWIIFSNGFIYTVVISVRVDFAMFGCMQCHVNQRYSQVDCKEVDVITTTKLLCFYPWKCIYPRVSNTHGASNLTLRHLAIPKMLRVITRTHLNFKTIVSPHWSCVPNQSI